MKFLSALSVAVILLLSSVSKAEVLASAGTLLSYELENNGRTYSALQPWSIRAGYGFHLADIYLEYSKIESTQGTYSVQVGRIREEVIVWAKRGFKKHWPMKPFIAAGPGLHFETVSTSLAGYSRKDRGQTDPLFAFVAGLQMVPNKKIEINFETRVAASASYSPNPMLSAGLFFGFRL